MKKKVLIVSTVGLRYDGISNVIVSYLKAMDLRKLDIYVAGTIKIETHIQRELENLGCHIVEFPSRRTNTFSYAYKLYRFIRKNKIDVIHAHGNSGTLAIEMAAAWLGGCKRRIAHSHNTRCDQIRADKILRPIFNYLYTDALACGEDAGKWLFGKKSFRVLRNGRDIELFTYDSEVRQTMKKRYNLSNELILGHVGGFYEQKNHRFLIEIFREILKLQPSAKLFLIGDGPLRNEIGDIAGDIYENVFFIGTTDHVTDYLQIMDGMILPSRFEGLPLVAIEWQINGLPCLFADTITRECVVTNTVEYLSLEDAPYIWAAKILDMIKKSDRLSNAENAKIAVKKAGFDIIDNTEELSDLYMK